MKSQAREVLVLRTVTVVLLGLVACEWLYIFRPPPPEPSYGSCRLQVWLIVYRTIHDEWGEEIVTLPDILPNDIPGRCPVAEATGIPASRDGYEYVGMGLRLKDIKNPVQTPIVFDRAGNHPDHTRCVGFPGATESEDCARWMPEEEFRKVLVQAIRRGAYPPNTVEGLKKEEPWLARELAGN